jgi:hypothetical protein
MSRRKRALAVALALTIVLASVALAGAEVLRKGTLQVAVSGKLSPQLLPRVGVAPIGVSVGGRILTTDKSSPPRLQTLEIELNRVGQIDYTGLPLCPYNAIQPASTARALSACRPALVGRGSFEAEITLPGQAPYSISGKLLAFNGRRAGKPVLFGQIYAPRPFANSFVIVFAISQLRKGAYGTALSAALPRAMGAWGKLTGIELTLSRRYSYRGRRHSYLSAGCPAPAGLPGASFRFARTSFGFEGGRTLRLTMTRSCRAK